MMIIGCSCTPLYLQATPISTTTSELNLPTVVVSIMPSYTNQAPTKTPDPTITIEPFTETPRPTLSPENEKELISTAKKTNLGCQLPCWWGITPEETSWNTTYAFFETFPANFETMHQHIGYHVKITDLNNNEELSLTFFLTEKRIVESLNVPAFYSLSDLLSNFGTPNQVWFYSGGVSAYSQPPSFSLALYYPDRGILFYYQDGVGEYQSDGKTLSIKVCAKHFASQVYPRLYLWNNQSSKTFEQIKTYLFTVPEDWYFRPLEEVTNFEPISFTKAFSDPVNAQCIVSPSDIWPKPIP